MDSINSLNPYSPPSSTAVSSTLNHERKRNSFWKMCLVANLGSLLLTFAFVCVHLSNLQVSGPYFSIAFVIIIGIIQLWTVGKISSRFWTTQMINAISWSLVIMTLHFAHFINNRVPKMNQGDFCIFVCIGIVSGLLCYIVSWFKTVA